MLCSNCFKMFFFAIFCVLCNKNNKGHIPLRKAFALGTQRRKKWDKQHEMYWPTQKCCVGDPPPPIFHWKWGLHWLPKANEIYTKKCNVHGQRKELASHNAKDTNMLVYFALGNAKFWRRVHCPTPTPDARYFASQWNIGLRLK